MEKEGDPVKETEAELLLLPPPPAEPEECRLMLLLPELLLEGRALEEKEALLDSEVLLHGVGLPLEEAELCWEEEGEPEALAEGCRALPVCPGEADTAAEAELRRLSDGEPLLLRLAEVDALTAAEVEEEAEAPLVPLTHELPLAAPEEQAEPDSEEV